MAVTNLACRECGAEYELDAQYVCDRCFGPLEVSTTTPRSTTTPPRCAAASRPARRTSGATSDFLPLVDGQPGPSARHLSRVGLPAGCTPLVRADRLAERLGLSERVGQERRANPTHSFKDRVVSVAAARARELGFDTLACASTGNLANAVAAHAAALGMPSYVFIPADLEEQKILATGVYGTNLVKVRGTYDDVNRLCTELCGEHESWAFVNVNMRPYYAEGSKTLAYEIAEQLGCAHAGPRRRADRLGLAVHQDRQGLRRVARARPDRGRRADDERRPGRRLLAGRHRLRRGHRRLPPGQARHDRQVAGDRQPGRRPLRARARARAPAAAIDSVTDDEIRDGIRLLAETTGIFTETAGGVTTATLAKLAERGDIEPDERVVLVITGEGLKTLDAVRGTFEAHEIEPRFDAFEATVLAGVSV